MKRKNLTESTYLNNQIHPTMIDKSWIEKPTESSVFKNGLVQYLDFAFSTGAIKGRILCPCIQCKFHGLGNRVEVSNHLLQKGFPRNYISWYMHGENHVQPNVKSELQLKTPISQWEDNNEYLALFWEVIPGSKGGLTDSQRLVETEKSFLPGCLEPPMLRGHCSASSAATGVPAQTINYVCPKTELVENSTVGEPEVIEEKVECSSPSLSLKLSDMVAIVGDHDGDDDDDDSETQSQCEDNVNGYQVKPEYMEILRKIINKHGDIAKNCRAKSVKCRSMMLEIICEVISALDNKDFTNLKGVKKMIGQIDDVKEMKVEVDWLHTRLTEILEARQIFKQSGKLKQKTDSITGFIGIAESELKVIEVEKKKLSQKLKEICEIEADWKMRLARMQEESIMTFQKVKDATSKVKRFLKCSLIDDLL